MKSKIVAYQLKLTPQAGEVYIKLQNGASGKVGAYTSDKFAAIAAILATGNAFYDDSIKTFSCETMGVIEAEMNKPLTA